MLTERTILLARRIHYHTGKKISECIKIAKGMVADEEIQHKKNKEFEEKIKRMYLNGEEI